MAVNGGDCIMLTPGYLDYPLLAMNVTIMRTHLMLRLAANKNFGIPFIYLAKSMSFLMMFHPK